MDGTLREGKERMSLKNAKLWCCTADKDGFHARGCLAGKGQLPVTREELYPKSEPVTVRSLEASEWVGRGEGGVLTRRDALDENHPDSYPSLWQAKYGCRMPDWAREVAGLPPRQEMHTCSNCGHTEAA